MNIQAARQVYILAIMSAGDLVLVDIVQEALEAHLIQNIQEGKSRFFVDGFPRSLDQALLFRNDVRRRFRVCSHPSADEI